MMMMTDLTLPCNERSQRRYTEAVIGVSSFNNSQTSDEDIRSQYVTALDHVAILGSEESSIHECYSKQWQHEPISFKRSCLFVLSCVFCVFATSAFLWLIPCQESNQCPAVVDRIKTHNWLNNYTRIELLGNIHVVHGKRSWEKYLVTLYRGDLYFSETNWSVTTKHNGVMSLIGSSGAVAWNTQMEAEPLDLDCSLIDIDVNSLLDCLLIDEFGVLYALNAQDGHWFWRYQTHQLSHEHTSNYALDLPLVLPDLDGDGVFEVLLVTNSKPNNKYHNYFRILSGRLGRQIGEDTRLHDCDYLRQLQMENAFIVRYSCIYNRSEVMYTKSLSELFALITNKSTIGSEKLPVNVIRKLIQQHRHYYMRYDSHNKINNNSNKSLRKSNKTLNKSALHAEEFVERNVYSLSGRELLVENIGDCPDNCSVTVVLSERITGKSQPKVLRNFTQQAMYGMVPVKWYFKDKQTKKVRMSGFVIKFWKWSTHLTSAANLTNRSKVHANESMKYELYENYNKYNITKHFFKSKNNKRPQNNLVAKSKLSTYNGSTITTPSSLASLTDTSNKPPADNILKNKSLSFVADKENLAKMRKKIVFIENYKMQMITESVILILFVGSETRIENTSQSSIVQFCGKESNLENRNFNGNRRRRRTNLICQPELYNQEQSMTIIDLDDDGSQELVTYLSTFVLAADEPSERKWRLVTYVRLLRLQTELPLFYQNQIVQQNKN